MGCMAIPVYQSYLKRQYILWTHESFFVICMLHNVSLLSLIILSTYEQWDIKNTYTDCFIEEKTDFSNNVKKKHLQ